MLPKSEVEGSEVVVAGVPKLKEGLGALVPALLSILSDYIVRNLRSMTHYQRAILRLLAVAELQEYLCGQPLILDVDRNDSPKLKVDML